MHFDCRQSYCETLKQQQQVRIPRDQPLDTDNGEFICPVCRQMANSLLPVPPEAQGLPVTIFPHNESDRMIAIAKSIYTMLKEESVNLTQPLRYFLLSSFDLIKHTHRPNFFKLQKKT